MAYDYISLNDGLPSAQKLRSDIAEVAQERRAMFGRKFNLFTARDKMLKMRDGDGSQDVHYALVTTKYGTASDAKSKSLFMEVDSVCGLILNGSATQAQITAAIDQLEALTQA